MAVFTVRAIADVDSVWSPSSGSSRFQMIWHGFSSPNDSEYVTTTSNHTQSFRLPGVPLDWSAITQVRVRFRYNSPDVGKTANSRLCTSRIYEDDGSTALTDASGNSTARLSTITNEYFTLNITGGTGQANWNNAVIKLTTSGSAGAFNLYEMEVEYTYNTTNMSYGYYKNRDPIGHWLWRPARYTTAGHVIRDYAGANDGEIVGSPTIDFSARGPVLDLNDGSSYIKVPASRDFTFSDGSSDKPFSVAMWFNTSDMTQKYLLSKGQKQPSGTSENVIYGTEYTMWTGGGDNLLFQLVDGSGAGAIRVYTSALTSYQNQWVHLVVTYDASAANTGITIYVNGLSVSLTRDTPGAGGYVRMRDTGGELAIGSYIASALYAAGNMHDVRIYGCELSAPEVKALYSITRRDPLLMLKKQISRPHTFAEEEEEEEEETVANPAFLLFLDSL